jgi:glycosyltransferase involved in cell wall biosynthesis
MERQQKIAAAAIFKNEAPYIVEWIAWHKAIGIQKFIIADNESTDESRRILEAFRKLGLVEYQLFPSGDLKSPQLAAYHQILVEKAASYDWVAFIDADEFIFPTSDDVSFGKHLAELPADVGAVVLNWACFGSSGNKSFENRPVIDRFSRRGPMDALQNVNLHYKSVVRPKAVIPAAPNPHHFHLAEGFRHARTDGRYVELSVPNGGMTHDVVWHEWRLNHYLTKSWSEFYRRKLPKGRSDRADLVRTCGYFFQYDMNEVSEPFPTDLRKRLASEISDLTTMLCRVDPGLKAVLDGFHIADAPPMELFLWSKEEPVEMKKRDIWRNKSFAKLVAETRAILWELFSRS